MKLIEFTVTELKKPKSKTNPKRIKSDYYTSSATEFEVTLRLATTSSDTTYTTSILKHLISRSHQVTAYPDSELVGESYPSAWTLNNSFWRLENGIYEYAEYIENTPVVREILKAIDLIVNNPKFNILEDNIICDLHRLLRALENFWN